MLRRRHRTTSPRAPRRRLVAAVTGAALVLVGLAVPGSPAAADTMPSDPDEPVSVAADALPTVQVDGVVWKQVVVGDRVYVAGSFSTARPAGAAPGTQTVSRQNLLAYDLHTGQLIGSWAPRTNAQVLTITASPDGSRLYIGGDFTEVNGARVWRIAAIDAQTGALIPSFTPRPDAKVRAIVATQDTVWFGGLFNAIGTEPRARLAAARASDGALLPWAPSATGASGVNAMVMSPDGSKLIVGGSFTELNGQSNPGYGLGAVDATTGESLPWAVNQLIRNGGRDAAILDLTADDELVYGSGYVFGTGGNLEGTFAAHWEDGALHWVEDCHGDTYSIWPAEELVYQASHKHYCGNIGGFPQTEPWTTYLATAVTKEVRGTITPDPYGYYNFAGNPRPEMVNWYPEMDTGTYTGQSQGPWTVTGTDQYVLMGGEFRNVNGRGQQGLVRFAVREIAPNQVGPRLSGGKIDLTARSLERGTVRVRWTANYDWDNRDLTYTLLRNSVTVVHQTTQASTFYERPGMGFVDRGLTPGVEYRYRLRVTDPYGNQVMSDTVWVTVSDAPPSSSSYADEVVDDDPSYYWRLGEPDGPVAVDHVGWDDAVVRGGVTRGRPGAILGDPDTASGTNGTTDGLIVSRQAEPGPQEFSVEAWFRTTSTRGGKIVGFGNAESGSSSSYDRHVYLDNAGRVWFGVYPNAVRTINTAESYNDGEWHHVVGTLDETGMALYVDGRRVGVRTDTTSAQAYVGHWRIGGDNLNGWPNRPTNDWFSGDVDEVAVYPTALGRADVVSHYRASGRTLDLPEPPADAYGAAVVALDPDLYWRLDETSGTVAADAGLSGTHGTFRGGVSLGTDGFREGSRAATFDGAGAMVASDRTFTNPRTYSTELWFRTTTTAGGKLIGFGNNPTGTSTNYDRHVYMETDGRLTFGVWTGQENTTTSTEAYNDGAWHHLVATQDTSSGMRLYVDGELVGSHPQTSAQDYTGHWKVGSDTTWGPQPHFAGTIDEVAVYPRALTAQEVATHWALGSAAGNVAPTASFTADVTHLRVDVDGTASADLDGEVVAWAWDFGDGATATGPTASHTYAAAGTYPVTLTVTDDQGAVGTSTQEVAVNEPPNLPPTASFTAGTSGLVVSVNGSASTDPDGTVVAHAWDFGDGATATGVTASHEYAEAGTYTVTLTVTDDRGGTATAVQEVTVTAPPAGVLASDDFERTGSGSWGAADVGGTWSHVGAPSRFAVSGGRGTHTIPSAGGGASTYLEGIASTATDVRVVVGTGVVPDGGGAFVSLTGRRVGTADYRAKVKIAANGALTLYLTRVAGAETTLATTSVPGVTYAPGARLVLRTEVTGTSPTTVRAKVWREGTAEPADWQLVTTDATATLQAPGGVGLVSYVSGTATTLPFVFSFDELRATVPGGGEVEPPPPVNQDPTAAFTAAVDGLDLTVDGSASADPDGEVVDWAWDFGDGATATGATASHTYGAAGTYTVTLTVTDDAGATATATQQVTVEGDDVPPPPVNAAPVAAFTAAVDGLDLTVDGSGSSDEDGEVVDWAWDFGDGATATGATASHTYGAAGTYTVTLTVTDDAGATATANEEVTVTEVVVEPPDDLLAQDAFERELGSGWGQAETGGAWSLVGAASAFSVSDGAGRLVLSRAGAGLTALLTGVQSTGTDATATFGLTPVGDGGGTFLSLVGRRVGAADYRAKAKVAPNGAVTLYLTRVDGGETNLAVTTLRGVTVTPGDRLVVRLEVTGTGTTQLRAKAWLAGTDEPTAWQLETTDSAPSLQAPGGVGVMGYLAGSATNAPVVVQVDDVTARAVP